MGAALALAAAGCDASGDDEGSASQATTREVTTTRVEVVEGIGREGGFDPGQIYSQLSPGVVTVISLFDGPTSLLEDGGEGGQGSGFVLDDEGYIATNAHVVTKEDDNSAQAERVFVQFPDGNRVPAEIVGADLNADFALLKIDPQGLDLTPLRSAVLRAPGGRARGGDRQPVRRGAVALGRGRLGARPQHPVAHAIRHRRRDPDRCRHQPRATPAAPCSTRAAA